MVPVVIRCIKGCDPRLGECFQQEHLSPRPEECSHGYTKDTVQTFRISQACGTNRGQRKSTKENVFLLFIHVKPFTLKKRCFEFLILIVMEDS